MASGVAAVPRISSSVHGSNVGGNKTPNLPVIQHPMAKLGDKNDLSIRGSSSSGVRREGFPRNGFMGFGPDGPSSAAPGGRTVGAVSKSTPDRIIQWPPVCENEAPYSYRRSAAERAGLVPVKEEIIKPLKSIVLPPIESKYERDDDDEEEDIARIKTNLKFPSLDQMMEIVEEVHEEHLLGPKAAAARVSKKQQETAQAYTSKSPFEVYDMVKDKMTTGYNGLKHLFRANDPTGQGTVSRDALLRILYTLCGYISAEQFSRFLKKINLDGKDSVSFDAFVARFKDNETVKKEWVTPVQRVAMEKKKRLLEDDLRNTDMLTEIPFLSAPFSDDLFRQKIKTMEDARKVFPAACFEPSGMIVPPQLREAFAQLGIYMIDRDFNTIWQRYDKDGLGAIFTLKFLRRIGVSDIGRPKSLTARDIPPSRKSLLPSGRPRPGSEDAANLRVTNNVSAKGPANEQPSQESSNEQKCEDTNNKTSKENENQTEVKDTNREEVTNEEGVSEKKVKVTKRSKKPTPKLDNIIDCLHYRFEEAYCALQAAFELFDYLSDGYISRVDFRRCLQEFGFTVKMSEIDSFLARIGVRSLRGQLNYREFLNKFQNKGDSSITNRIVTSQHHTFQNGVAVPTDLGFNAEELECKLVEYFHGDFIRLISHFRSCDKYNLGVITAHEFRSGIERQLGYQMTEKQWEQLLTDTGRDPDGLIQYPNFLKLFDVIRKHEPGSWNKKKDNGAVVPQLLAKDMELPPEIDVLKEAAKVAMVPREKDKPKPEGRTLEDVEDMISDLFRNRFHTFDKHYKEMDRKMVGRMSKWQFGALLKLSGVTITTAELDKLWLTVNTAQDGLYSYSSLIQHFVENKTKTVERSELNVQEDTNTKDLIAEARRVQRERVERKRTEKRKETLDVKTETAVVERSAASAVLEHQKTTAKLLSFPPTPANSVPPSAMSSRSVRTKELLIKIKSDVVNNWEGLKSVFKFIDKNGTATVSKVEMLDVMNSMQFSITTEEKEELCQRFDLRKNGRFHYIEFMKCFSQRTEQTSLEKSKSFAYSKHTHTLQKKHHGADITVAKVLCHMREKLMTQHCNLRRAFKKFDVCNKGYISITEFRKCLRQCGVDVSNDDFYHIMTQFDRRLAGQISYDDFLATFIDV